MKVAIYIRVSTHHQIDKDSLPLQRQDLMNYCEYVLNTKGYEIFEDAGYSAKNTDRPRYQDMMNRIRKGEFSHLLVWKIDRISRNLLDFCDMYEEIKKYNCIFVSKNEQFDTGSAMGEAMLKIILVFAELERKLTAERVTAIMLDRASKGMWNGAPVPLGYKWDSKIKFPAIDEEESKVVELIFGKYEELQSTSAVRNILNSLGVKTKRDGSWTTKTLSDVIRNPFYKGTYRYNYRNSIDQKKKKEDEWIMLEDNHPAIITKDMWQKCNNIMDENALRNNARFRSNVKTHLFSGLLECGECHNSLYAKQDKPHLDGYIPSLYCCSGRYNKLGCEQRTTSEKLIGEFVLNYVATILKAKKKHSRLEFEEFSNIITNIKQLKNVIAIDGLENLYNSMNLKNTFTKIPKTDNNDIEIERLKKEKSKYERALERLEDLYLFDDEGISEKDYIIKKNKIVEKLNEVNIEFKKYINTDSNNENFILAATTITLIDTLMVDENINIKDVINEVGRDLLKEFLNAIIDKIIVKDKKVMCIRFKNGIENRFIYTS